MYTERRQTPYNQFDFPRRVMNAKTRTAVNSDTAWRKEVRKDIKEGGKEGYNIKEGRKKGY